MGRCSDAAQWWLNAAGRQPLLTPAEEVHLGQAVRRWLDHPAGPAGAPAGVRRQGLRARDRMVNGNLRLVASIATKSRSTVPAEDLLQAGAMGLLRAAEKFDPARGYKFSTYATWWIRQAIGKAIEERFIISIPSGQQDRLRQGSGEGVGLQAAALLAMRPATLDAPAAGAEGDSPLSEVIEGSRLDVVDLDRAERAAAALAALQRADPDAMAVSLLVHQDGASWRDVAQLEGDTYRSLAYRTAARLRQLRSLPEVAAALAG